MNTVVTEQTCGICLEDSRDPLDLPCGHSFCGGCLDEWRSRYGVEEEMRRKCPICRARIPPSKEMVSMLHTYRATKKELEDHNDTSSEHYHLTCSLLERAEAEVGADWDGMTFLEDNNDKHTGRTLLMPEYVHKAFRGGDVKTALRWITANQTEDRVNSVFGMFSCLATALMLKSLTLMTLLLQLGADVDRRDFQGQTLICSMFCPEMLSECGVIERARLLLSWGASFPREVCVSTARMYGRHELANLLESELGGRRCEIVNLSARPELNGKTCVADEYLPDSNRYRVTLETKSKAILVIGPGKLKRRDRTPQDCGYYIEFKNGRTIRHDFDSSEECQAFVAAMNRDETQPAVTEEAEARAERAAAELLAELLAELGLDDSPHEAPTGEDQAKKSKKKKKKGGKKKRK